MSFGSSKPMTRAESARIVAVKEGPCLACEQRNIFSRGFGVDAHHLLSGGRRRGHLFTIGLCPWHHRGVVSWGCTHQEMRDEYGPSLAEGSRPFHAAFGSDDELLARQNKYLGASEAA